MVEFKKLSIHSGLIVESLEVTLGDQLEQIAIARLILGQQSKMIGGFVGWVSAAAIGRGDIDFAADDWFYACLLSSYIEIDYAIHGAVVSDSQAVHAQFLGSRNELRYATHTIEQTIFTVDVKVGKPCCERSVAIL